MAAFTPEEIESRRFVSAIRGYDREEVDAFLRAVADDVRRAGTEVSAAPGPDVHPVALCLAALAAVQRAQAETLLADARREAERVRASARHEAQAIVVHARCLQARLLARPSGTISPAIDAEIGQMAAAWWEQADQQLDEAIDHLGKLQETLLRARDGSARRSAAPAYPVEDRLRPAQPAIPAAG